MIDTATWKLVLGVAAVTTGFVCGCQRQPGGKSAQTETRFSPPVTEPLPEQVQPSLHWFKTLDEAAQYAKSHKSRVGVFLETDWSAPCQLLRREAFTDKEVGKLLKPIALVSVHVDSEEGKDFAKKYQSNAVPCLLVLSPDGKHMGRVNGYIDVTDFRKKLSRALRQQ